MGDLAPIVRQISDGNRTWGRREQPGENGGMYGRGERGVSKIIDQRLSPSTPPNPIALIQALLNSRAITSTQP